MNDAMVEDFAASNVFGDCFACNCHLITKDGAWLLEQFMQYSTYAARSLNILDKDVRCRSQLGDMWYTVSNFVNTFKRIIDPCFLSKC
ncbi:hypothetical protein D3C73_1348190 [compost metagenome]